MHSLRFMLDFAHCLVEVAGARGAGVPEQDAPQASRVQQQSLVADQISSLSREWRSAYPKTGWELVLLGSGLFTCCCCSSHAEQLVLYLKSAELLSGALHTAMERVRQGKLYPSATVKQGTVAPCPRRHVRAVKLTPLCCAVVRKLNELYKSSVASCRSLSTRLERFFSRKHRLMDQISSITAERLLFSHAVQMVCMEAAGRPALGCL